MKSLNIELSDKIRAATINELYPLSVLKESFTVDFEKNLVTVKYDKILSSYEYKNYRKNFNVWFKLSSSVNINLQELINYFSVGKFVPRRGTIYLLEKVNKNNFLFQKTNNKIPEPSNSTKKEITPKENTKKPRVKKKSKKKLKNN